MFNSALCRLSGHKINRRRVWHDGNHFLTKCERCGQPLIRTGTGWKATSAEEQAPPPNLNQI